MFDKGYTGANGRQQMTATRVGLYLSNKIAKKLGHAIQITSYPQKGTVAEIILKGAGVRKR